MGSCSHRLQKQIMQEENKNKKVIAQQHLARRENQLLNLRKITLENAIKIGRNQTQDVKYEIQALGKRIKDLQNRKKKAEKDKRQAQDKLSQLKRGQSSNYNDMQNQLQSLLQQIKVSKQRLQIVKRGNTMEEQAKPKLKLIQKLKKQINELQGQKAKLLRKNLYLGQNKAQPQLKRKLSKAQLYSDSISRQQLFQNSLEAEVLPIKFKYS